MGGVGGVWAEKVGCCTHHHNRLKAMDQVLIGLRESRGRT